VSYWLPALEVNPCSVVQLFDPDEYGRRVKMRVRPEPDTIIRLFMIFERAEHAVPVGAPELPSIVRAGFSVVEWGGVNLSVCCARPCRGHRPPECSVVGAAAGDRDR
jgi:hypothetical protein